jgi:hypothetical protein
MSHSKKYFHAAQPRGQKNARTKTTPRQDEANPPSDPQRADDRLADSEADLVSITEKIDTTTGMGRFFFTTIAALAQLERDQISERTRLALAHKREMQERVSGHIPYGYSLAKDGVCLIEDRREQRAIQKIHRLREAGLSTRQIGREMDRFGLRPRQGWHWHPKVVMDVCRRIGVE